MDDYAGRILAGRYRLPLPPSDAYELVETRAFDTRSGQEVLVRQVPLPEVVDAELIDGGRPERPVPGGPAAGEQPGELPAVRRAIEAAQAAARIPDHPRLDQVFDVFAEGGSLWIVSELVPARPLAALIADAPLSPYRAAEVASDVLTALRVLHAHGWTHRNITMRTVLICDDGRVVLTGLAAGAAEEALCGYDPVPPPDETPAGSADAPGAPGTSAPPWPTGPIPPAVPRPAAPGAASAPADPTHALPPGGTGHGLTGHGPLVPGQAPPGSAVAGAALPDRQASDAAAPGPAGADPAGAGAPSGANAGYGGTSGAGLAALAAGQAAPGTGTPASAGAGTAPSQGAATAAPGPQGPAYADRITPGRRAEDRPDLTAAARAGAVAAYRAGTRAATARVMEEKRAAAGQEPPRPRGSNLPQGYSYPYGGGPAKQEGPGVPAEPGPYAVPGIEAAPAIGAPLDTSAGPAPHGGPGAQVGTGIPAGPGPRTGTGPGADPDGRSGWDAQAGSEARAGADVRPETGSFGGPGSPDGPGTRGAVGTGAGPGGQAGWGARAEPGRQAGAGVPDGSAGPRTQAGPVVRPWPDSDDGPGYRAGPGGQANGQTDGQADRGTRTGPDAQGRAAAAALPAGPGRPDPTGVPDTMVGRDPMGGADGADATPWHGATPRPQASARAEGRPEAGPGGRGDGPIAVPPVPYARPGLPERFPLPQGYRQADETGAPSRAPAPGAQPQPVRADERTPSPAHPRPSVPAQGQGRLPAGDRTAAEGRPPAQARGQAPVQATARDRAPLSSDVPARPDRGVAAPAPVPVGHPARVSQTRWGSGPGPGSGLAAERARQTRITVVGAVTERWAPEQARPVQGNWQLAAPVGPATDLWALGALLYRCVQGHAPYPEDSAAELVEMVCAEPPAFAEECGPLRPVVESLLRQDPTERPDFEELRGWLRSLVRSAPEPDGSDRTVPLPAPDPARLPIVRRRAEVHHGRHRQEKAARTPRGPRSLGRNLLLGILLGLAALVAFAMLFLPEADETKGAANSGPAGQASSAPDEPNTPSQSPSSPVPPKASAQPPAASGGPGGTPAPQPSAPAPAGYTVAQDPEGFRMLVPSGWERSAKNDAGQVRYSDGTYELIVVPGRDAIDGTPDPLSYQKNKERELDPFRMSTWATSTGTKQTRVGQKLTAEGTYTWTDATGRSLYVRNHVAALGGRYHVVMVLGPQDQQDKVTEVFGRATGSYRMGG
ncbi:hypothetical protein [Streptomyces sp. NPDC089799]|uniref:hypothetical protein n=1 Tax=Streptomyces sp. NPDC089799 TaxID=3155066 RepID=UPI00343CE821